MIAAASSESSKGSGCKSAEAGDFFERASGPIAGGRQRQHCASLIELCCVSTETITQRAPNLKEYYFYIDSTPTHSYMKYLYKYPQEAFPYTDLIETNKRRNRGDMEYELLDTGVFNEDRYFDVFVEYAKQSPEDILIQISVSNRGPEPAELHVLPTL